MDSGLRLGKRKVSSQPGHCSMCGMRQIPLLLTFCYSSTKINILSKAVSGHSKKITANSNVLVKFLLL